jgi:hypothetical protein
MAPVDPATTKLNRSEPYQRLLSTLSVPTAKKNVGAARQELDRRLTCALRKYKDGPDGGRRGVCIAVAAVYDFIAAAAPQCAGKFNLFNMVLVAALCDLDRGIVTPLVQKKGQGRDANGFAYKEIQHRAAAAMRSLMDIEFDRDEAAEKVANTLIRNGLRDATPRAVKKWYDEKIPAKLKLTRRPRTGTQPPKDQNEGYFFYTATTNRLRSKGYKQKKFSDELLDELSCFIQLWFPGAMREASEI